jgi:hypothetical protein
MGGGSMHKISEVAIIMAGGAIGGLVSVMEAWGDPSSFPLSLAKLFALLIIPLVKGGVAAGIGVYVLTSLDSNQMAKAFFFSVACGLTFPSILTKSGSMIDSVTSKVSQISITENVSIIKEEIAKGKIDNTVDVARIKDASEKIIMAEKKVENLVKTDAEFILNDAIFALGLEAKAGDENAINAIVDIGKLSSKSSFSAPRLSAIRELEIIQKIPGVKNKLKSRALVSLEVLKQDHRI